MELMRGHSAAGVSCGHQGLGRQQPTLWPHMLSLPHAVRANMPARGIRKLSARGLDPPAPASRSLRRPRAVTGARVGP